MYVLMIYSYGEEYRKQIGKPSSSRKKLEKVQNDLDDRLDWDNFYSIIEEVKGKMEEPHNEYL